MEIFFEKYNKNQIQDYIYFADEHRDRKLNLIKKLQNSNIPAKEALLETLQRSFMSSHEVPSLLEALENGQLNLENEDSSGATSKETNEEFHNNPREQIDNERDIEIATSPRTEESNSPFPNFCNMEMESDVSSDEESPSGPMEQGPQYQKELIPSSSRRKEEEFRQIVDKQNILKSETRFKCVCACQPEIVSDSFIDCYYHMVKNHTHKIVIPSEACSLCGKENLSVFKNIHKCTTEKRHRPKNKHWRQSERYK